MDKYQALLNFGGSLLVFLTGYVTHLKKKLATVEKLKEAVLEGSSKEDGLVKKVKAIEVQLDDYDEVLGVLRAIEKHVNGDEEKDGLVRRVNAMSNLATETNSLHTQIEAVQSQANATEMDLTALQRDVIKEQQAVIVAALAPVWKVLEKKADKELLEVQVKHLMDAITRLGSSKK